MVNISTGFVDINTSSFLESDVVEVATDCLVDVIGCGVVVFFVIILDDLDCVCFITGGVLCVTIIGNLVFAVAVAGDVVVVEVVIVGG